MDIGLLGVGSVGSTLGRRFAQVGHRVHYGVRDPKKRATLLDGHPGSARLVSPKDLPETSDLIVLAVPHTSTQEALASMGKVEGKILVDATNPLKPDLSALEISGEDSAGERVARMAKGAHVVKAFNTVGAGVMADPVLAGRAAALLVCSDHLDSKVVVLDLATSIGFEAIDFGGLEHARLTEAAAMTWIWLAYVGKWGTGFAFSVARR
jgi:predicted dinucleotide-binding enzyme